MEENNRIRFYSKVDKIEELLYLLCPYELLATIFLAL